MRRFFWEISIEFSTISTWKGNIDVHVSCGKRPVNNQTFLFTRVDTLTSILAVLAAKFLLHRRNHGSHGKIPIKILLKLVTAESKRIHMEQNIFALH